MKVLSAEFVTSAAADGPLRLPRDAPQIAFVGRSNVGKSSLINALCRRRIARTSAAPGKTRLANFYRVSVDAGGSRAFELYLVDLPGYGYARGGPAAARELKSIAEAYLTGGKRQRRERPFGAAQDRTTGTRQRYAGGPPELQRRQKLASEAGGVLLLVDSRHPGLDADLWAHEWLTGRGAAPHIVATKIDKLSRAERARNLDALSEIFGTAALPVSAQSGEGLNDLWQLIIKRAKSR